jgi:hypothetical protein
MLMVAVLRASFLMEIQGVARIHRSRRLLSSTAPRPTPWSVSDRRLEVEPGLIPADFDEPLHASLDMRLFLRAERELDGRRPFKLLEREPLPTSYGEDSYRRRS